MPVIPFQKLKILWSRNWLSTWILFFVVAAAPFPFGSTSKTVIAFWCILLSIAVILLSLRDVGRRQLWVIAGLFVIVAGYAFVLHEQLSDHPWIAPFHPIWKQASELLGTPLAPSVSIVKNEPFFALGAPLANIMALLLGFVIGLDRTRARQIVWILAGSGFAYALYGIVSTWIDPTMLLWRDRIAYVGSVTGTFINRNTAAAYFGSCSLIWLLLLLQTVRRKMPERRIAWRQLRRTFPKLSPRDILPSSIGLLVCLMAMFLTESRAGVAFSLLAMIVAVTLYLRKDLPPKTGILIALGIGASVALVLLEFLGGRVSTRYDTQGLTDIGRIETWKSTIRIISDYPWFGTGMGTFVWSFPQYRSDKASMWGIWDAAHSTPLELASEVGLPLAGLVATGWIVMLVLLGLGSLTRRRGRIVPIAAWTIAMLALLHSAVDFTLQIPGYAIPFFAFFGTGLAQSFSSSSPTDLQIAHEIMLETSANSSLLIDH